MTETADFNPISLLSRIKRAESNEKLSSLETEGAGYKYAKPGTRNRWVRAIQVRRSQLS